MAVSRKVAAAFGAAGVALFALSGAALAEEFSWSASLTGTSDYVFRGLTQTDGDPTMQGSVGFGYGIFYAGAWASGLDFGPGTDAEIEVDYYAGIKPTWGPATFDFGVIYYDYPGYSAIDPEILELKAGVSGNLADKLSAGATIYYSPDYNNYDWGVYEGTLGYALPGFHGITPSVTGTVGYFDYYSGGTDYTYWNAGLALAVDHLTFDLRYWDTDISGCTGGAFSCDERFVFSATVAMP